MRIKSPFKDYYDCMLAHDKEPEPLFVRRSSTISLGDKTKDYLDCRNWNIRYKKHQQGSDGEVTYNGIIVFCTELWPFVELYVKDNRIGRSSYFDEPGLGKKHVFYTIESINRFVSSHRLSFVGNKNCRQLSDLICELEKSLFDWQNIPQSRLSTYLDKREVSQHGLEEACRRTIRRHFDRVFDDDKYTPQNILSECPILLLQAGTITVFPQLSGFEFGKVKPPQNAYQELMRWFSNKAVPLKPIPKIDDKTMAEIKGFDKWSFRKEPA